MLTKPGNPPYLSTFLRLIVLLLMLLGMFGFQSVQVVYAATVIYVQPSGLTSGSCSAWASACELQYALSLAVSGDEIWVAAGTYYPTSGADRTASFLLINGVSLYGGFAGTETLLTQRDPAINVTILSGDLGTPDNTTDNSYHVVKGNGTNSSAVLDGFTITYGNASGSSPDDQGGGIFNDSSSPTLSNLIITANTSSSFGGGVYNNNSNPTLTNVTISSNAAGSSSFGGGMFNNGSSPVLTDVSFSSNSAQRGAGMYNIGSSNATLMDVTFSSNVASLRGGGIAASGSNLSLTNVTFSGNSAGIAGGGMQNVFGSSSSLTNVTFSGNSAGASGGGGLYNDSSTPTLTNVIIANSTAGGDCVTAGTPSALNAASANNLIESAASACGLANGVSGNIIGSDPNLGSLANNGGFTLTLALNAGSPAIDAGNNASCPTLDQRGVARPQPQGGQCDIGAYEVDTTVPTVTNVTSTTANGTYGVGSVIAVRVSFSESVAVTGTPQLTLETGGTDRVVDYSSGSGTST